MSFALIKYTQTGRQGREKEESNMDEQKKTLGRSRIYTGDPDGHDPGEYPEGSRRNRRAGAIDAPVKEHLAAPAGRRRRDEETDAKMRLLWVVLFILIAVLVASIFYEIVLGYGSLETGSQRMGDSTGQTELVSGTEEEESESDESETSAEQGVTNGQATSTGDSSEDGQATSTGDGSEDSQVSSTGEDSGDAQAATSGADGSEAQANAAETDMESQIETEDEAASNTSAEASGTGADATAQAGEGTSVVDVSTLAGVGE